MKYASILATVVIGAGLVTAFQVDARKPEPRYNLNFAFGTDTAMGIEIGATDTFHVMTRRGRVSYEVSGVTIPQDNKIATRLTTCKAITEPVQGPDNQTADSIQRASVNSVILLIPGGDPVPVGGSQDEPFTLSISRVK